MAVPAKRRHVESHDHSAAVEHVVHQHQHHAKSKAEKRFEKKVLRVIEEPQAKGKYSQTTTGLLVQENFNLYSFQIGDSGDGTGVGNAQWEFFSPRQFKDAEAVLFNAKTAKFNSWAVDVTEGANHNFPAQEKTKVNASSATFRFKNISQHKTIVEMYICKGKGGGSYPTTDWETSLLASGKYVINGITTPPVAGYLSRSTHVHMSALEPFDSYWKVEKCIFKFEPGEEAFHILKGPRGYEMDGSSKVIPTTVFGTTPTWKGPEMPGCGTIVFFRVLNNLTLVTSTTGSKITTGNPIAYTTNNIQVCHPPHLFNNGSASTDVGGVALEVTRHYSIEAPMGVTVPLNNATVLNINYGVPAGIINDIEIDVVQPDTIPSAPL